MFVLYANKKGQWYEFVLRKGIILEVLALRSGTDVLVRIYRDTIEPYTHTVDHSYLKHNFNYLGDDEEIIRMLYLK